MQFKGGFGFLRADDANADRADDIFFHSSETGGRWKSLRRGDVVEYEAFDKAGKLQARIVDHFPAGEQPSETRKRQARVRTRKFAGSYKGATLDLSPGDRRAALEEISKWKLEARLDDIGRYFFAIPELKDVVTGDASYVIGRKGTGKTALVQYLSNHKGRDGIIATKLTFKNYPFNELYKQSNDTFTRPNQYITIWKLIIYSSVCRMMSQSGKIDPLLKKTIDKAFPVPSSDQLGTIIGQWIAGDFGINILGNGVTAGKWFQEKKQHTLQDKVNNLEGFVKNTFLLASFLYCLTSSTKTIKRCLSSTEKASILIF